MTAAGHGSSRPVARFLRIALGIVAVLPAALIVAYLVGSLILSGGKVSEPMDTKWDVVRPYPLFVVPTVPLVIIGALAIVLAIAVALTSRASDSHRVQRLIGPLLASAVGGFLFSILTPDAAVRMGDRFMGTQWIGSVLSVIAVAVLSVGMLAVRARESGRTEQDDVR